MINHRAKAVHGEGRIGGPCHTIKSDRHFCDKKAIVVAQDGYGYCKRHSK